MCKFIVKLCNIYNKIYETWTSLNTSSFDILFRLSFWLNNSEQQDQENINLVF